MTGSQDVHGELGRLTLVLAAAAALVAEVAGLLAGDGPEQALLKASVALVGTGLMGGVLELVMSQAWGQPRPPQAQTEAMQPEVEGSARQGKPADGELAAND
ncbi:MAG: hypothetical protein HYY02_02020 [Chloroflexi bacterium]|nr:hypothetical protein [Chloroflexota bacterium]